MDSSGRLLIDAHTHISTIPIYARRIEDRTPGEKALDEAIDSFIDWLDRFSIDAAAVSGLVPMMVRNWPTRHGGNEEVVALMKRRPRAVIGQYVPNVYEGPEPVRDKIREAVQVYGFRGIKIHPWASGYPANSPLLYPVFEAAEEHGLSVLFHSGTAPYCTPLLIADMAMRFPRVPVIMGHMGKHELYLDVIPAAKLSPNVYLETSGSYIQALLEKAVTEIGAERVLFGTDGPAPTFGAMAYRVDDLEVSDEAKAWILGRSAAKLLGIEGRA